MNTKHSALAAAVVTAAVPAGVLAAGAGASIARTASAPARTAATATVALRSTKLGKILVVGRSGRTLYLFNKDGKNKSNCTGQCAAIWPPLKATRPTAGAGVSARKLGSIKGSHQVTYAGHPLYTFVSDSGAGKTT